MLYSDLRRELAGLTIPFEEGAWCNASDMEQDYGVYEVESDLSLRADGKITERVWRILVDLYIWGGKGYRQAHEVEAALERADVEFELMISGYEEGNGFTHWRWQAWAIPSGEV